MVLTEFRQPHGVFAVKILWKLSPLMLLLALTVGCGVTYSQWSFQRQLLAVDAQADRGEYMEAREGYIALAEKAESQVDLQYLQFRAAYMLEQQKDAEGALQAYASIYTRPTHLYDDYAGRALYRAGRVYQDILGDPATARDVWRTLVLGMPDSMFADDALVELRRHAEKTSTQSEFIEWMADVYPQVQDREIADNFVYLTGVLLQDDLDRCDEAIVMYSTLKSHFQRSSFVDDGVWRTSLCHRKRGRIDEEYAVLRESVEGREISVLVGDYNYSHYNPAMRRMAEIHEERGEIEAAIRAWRNFQKVFIFSLDSDDVQYRIIELNDQLGRVSEMRRLANEMERNWPESRYLPRAWALVEAAEARR